MQQYQQRINDLKTIAVQEGIAVSPSSLEDFRTFVKDLPTLPRAGLILTDQGHLAAIWADGQGAAFEVEFLGEGHCKTIDFTNRTGQPKAPPKIDKGSLKSTADRIKEIQLARQDDQQHPSGETAVH